LERIMSDTSHRQNPSSQSGGASGSGTQQQQFRDSSSSHGQQSGSTGSGSMGSGAGTAGSGSSGSGSMGSGSMGSGSMGSGSGLQSGRGSSGMGEQTSAAGRDIKDRTSDLAGSAARELKERASGFVDTAKGMASGAGEKLLGAVDEQKKAGAQQVRGIAQVVRTAADGLEGEIPQAAQYVRRAAEQIENISDALERREVGELVGQVQDFARRHPTAFLGATVIAGFALIRFLKSSTASSRGDMASGYGHGESERFGGSAQHRYGGAQSPSSNAQRGGAAYGAGSSGGMSSQGSGYSPRPSTSGPSSI
jgi:hypothetical protein